MHYQGYSIEILVDNSPLVEVTEPSDKSIVPLAKSYVSLSNLNIRHESSTTHFACVPSANTSFLIRATCPRAHNMVAEFWIDGRSDRCRSYLCNGEAIKKGFHSSDGKNRLLFKFSSTLWNDTNTDSRSSGEWDSSPGCVTVAFWESCKVKTQRKQRRENSTRIEPVRITEDKYTKDLEMTVQFEEETLGISSYSSYRWKKTTMNPVAVLHLYYRSAYVLAGKGHDVSLPNPDLLPDDEYILSHSSPSQTKGTSSKGKGVKHEVDRIEEFGGPSRKRTKREEDVKIDAKIKEGMWFNPIFVESEEENEGSDMIVLD